VILNRSPVITRTPTPFERAYYAYQQRIARALHNPFPHEFYFKPGAPLEQRFRRAGEEDEALASRWTKADEAKDVRSLDRQGQRNLYLVLLKKEGGKETWTFPSGDVKPDELLHEVRWPCPILLA
jgi:large subunit ribosomal protein L46